MKTALSALALVLSVSSFALAADLTGETVKFKGAYANNSTVTGNLQTVQENDVVVFNNIDSTIVTGFSRLNTEVPTYGAALNLAQGGRLQELYFTIFNPSNSVGNITGGLMTLRIYDNTTPYSGTGAITNPLLGTVAGNLNYAAPADQLPPGFFLTDGFVGLNSLNIVLPQNVLVTQTFVPTGGTRNGYVAFAPDLVGSTDNTVYISSTALTAGYYNLGTAPNFVDATPGYALVVPEPASIATLALTGLVLRRRR